MDFALTGPSGNENGYHLGMYKFCGPVLLFEPHGQSFKTTLLSPLKAVKQ